VTALADLPATGAGRQLRFAMVTTFYPPYHFGGDGVYIRRLVHALARRGHSVDVIHDVDAYVVGGGDGSREPLPEPEGVRVHALRSRSSLMSTLITHQVGRPLVHGSKIRRVLNDDIDVVNFHNVSLVGGPGVLSYGTGIKLYTAHEHWLVCPMHILWRHGREPCDGRECLRCTLSAGRPPQLWRGTGLLEKKAREVDAFLALSEFSARKHREFGFETPMEVFPSFLPDDAAPAAVPQRGRDTEQYFLFVGRLEAIKGLDDVIPLFDESSKASLWIAGTGAHEPALRELARNRPKVRFLGHLPADELRSLYRNAIALLIPSRCYEVFPLVALEAFREGTPIVARRLGPLPEIVESTGGGLLFSTPAELRSALGALEADAGKRDALGAAALSAFGERWSESAVLSRYFALIRRIAERRGLHDVLGRLPAGS
jgi:glycosyltransferase involved in cell wall biosynthesis